MNLFISYDSAVCESDDDGSTWSTYNIILAGYQYSDTYGLELDEYILACGAYEPV
jgi:hypothetical protein